jgi:NAD(P)-dependent dehydrogenase (short-subunit alcohol dehydrogenase family)
MILSEKKIIVTGGNGLIGSEICRDIKLNGGVAINLDLHPEEVGNKIFCDITDYNSILNAISKSINLFGNINGLVNNAYPRTKDWSSSFEVISYNSLKTNVDWQLNSYLLFCQKILPILRESQGGSVVNLASIYGVVGNDFSIYENTDMEPPMPYSAIKGGLISSTRYLASKYGKENIRFNCVSPGGVFDNQPNKFVDAYEKKTPLGRMAKPSDIAPTVSFLLSEKASYITGQNIIIDGGFTSI